MAGAAASSDGEPARISSGCGDLCSWPLRYWRKGPSRGRPARADSFPAQPFG